VEVGEQNHIPPTVAILVDVADFGIVNSPTGAFGIPSAPIAPGGVTGLNKTTSLVDCHGVDDITDRISEIHGLLPT